ncbi:MAG: hypothetical protein CMA70_04340 [Euryarchaeota archaeon]|nr:hypothetical protein [Euryarchaeota archaeon]|tara:strand:- start:105 stop:455 length:351 start_codon:yes stop_codon:yes gene_type:complete
MTKTETIFDTTGESITGTITEWMSYLEKRMEELNNDYAIEKMRTEWALEGINQDTMKAGREASLGKMGTADVYLKQAAEKMESLRDHYRNMETTSREVIKLAKEHSTLTARVRDAK